MIKTLFPMPPSIDVEEADKQLPAHYYRWPEGLLTLHCTCCSFVWDCPFLVDIDEKNICGYFEGLTWEPQEEGDDLCPRCQRKGIVA